MAQPDDLADDGGVSASQPESLEAQTSIEDITPSLQEPRRSSFSQLRLGIEEAVTRTRIIHAYLHWEQVYYDGFLQRLNRGRRMGLTIPRLPAQRIWPVYREAGAVLCVTVLLAQFVPPAFAELPSTFAIAAEDPLWKRVLAATAGAGIIVAAFLVNFTVYGVAYVHRWYRCVACQMILLVGASFGVPFALLLLRFFEAVNAAPLDPLTFAFATWNFAVPGVMLVLWPPSGLRFYQGRRLYVAALASLTAWMLASMPSETLVATLLLLAILDVVLVALPCCSPVQTLDKLTWERGRSGEPQVPGVTFQDPAKDGLLLGLGDFIVFSIFSVHAARGGAAPLAATAVGIMHGLTITMLHVALKWPSRSLIPAIPASVILGTVLLVAERFALRPLAGILAAARIWI